MNKFFLILAMVAMQLMAVAQDEKIEELTIPLSKPGEAGKLKVDLIYGSIKVTGYDGQEVLIKVSTRKNVDEAEEEEQEDEAPTGFYKIENNTFAMTVYEENNEVRVNSEARKQKLIFDIMVPRKFDLDVNTVNGGDIEITNIEGEIEAGNVNGGINIQDVSGSVVANTVNGPVIATLKSVTAETPMAFVSLNGKIDVTLPKDTKLTTKIKSDWGQVYSDFKMEVKKSEPKVEKKSGKNYTKYVVDKWIYGDVNGGGPECMFKNMHGDIYIRMK
ncbi:hypothetical protein R9C00_05790 [Flammeovirgaceae bacterium SG7u.111]|nr:hypothetical protein [Flammeovirgaceae bacterium SG7u.132]WPO36953.1 hypothetical protein R9C00_05790 [Flammeovirgaceae bacterium SG7u.111]